jgi:hypothetical protein
MSYKEDFKSHKNNVDENINKYTIVEDTASYISSMTAELAHLAKSVGLDLLCEYLKGAKIQAEICCFHSRPNRLNSGGDC